MSFLWQITTDFGACAGVVTDDKEVIIEAAPIYGKFVGQPLTKLRNWSKTIKVTAVGPVGKKK